MAVRKSRQQMIDDQMCKPGYTWNETLGRCLGGGYIKAEKGKSGETPNGAVRQEIIKRVNSDAQAIKQPQTLPME